MTHGSFSRGECPIRPCRSRYLYFDRIFVIGDRTVPARPIAAVHAIVGAYLNELGVRRNGSIGHCRYETGPTRKRERRKHQTRPRRDGFSVAVFRFGGSSGGHRSASWTNIIRVLRSQCFLPAARYYWTKVLELVPHDGTTRTDGVSYDRDRMIVSRTSISTNVSGRHPLLDERFD